MPSTYRNAMRTLHRMPEVEVLADLTARFGPDADEREKISRNATVLVEDIRSHGNPGLMESFLVEYGLSTDEGIALMCLAEALLRVPDAETIDELIEDKIAPSEWGKHLGHSSSSLVNASTWALMLTGKVLQESQGLAETLRGAMRRVGEPVIRLAVQAAMREMGQQFVLGQTIGSAVKRGARMVAKGYTYSYDMLGEAALTQADADTYFDAYAKAIDELGKEARSGDIRENPGISIKLSALHPRYEVAKTDRVLAELTERTIELARMAKSAGMGLNIDAEESYRLDLSLDIIERVLSDRTLAGWDGFGVVVQAYGKRASAVLDHLYDLAENLDRKIMVRLVKGAYWDTEIKLAQVEGLDQFPVFTRKEATDVSYICCARQLLGMTDRIYPQFATHNAHTIEAVIAMADDKESFEFQRLHGMGEVLHDLVRQRSDTRCRIYAPVGAHRDLLAYLVRRLLENGANSSFVNQIVDPDVPASEVVRDPFELLETRTENRAVIHPADLFGSSRKNARGWDLADMDDLGEIERARGPFETHRWQAAPIVAFTQGALDEHPVINPAKRQDIVGAVSFADATITTKAVASAKPWDADVSERAAILNRVADLYEANFGEMFALLCREAGKSLPDAVSELREAVDFLRYYADRAKTLSQPARGVFACISPWNFPLAIFTGQIAAALATGNGVLAKPAETTSLIAFRAVELMHEAGVPAEVLQLLTGEGRVIGNVLTSDARINGVCFTGSTATAQIINRNMAAHLSPDAPLIAETGGLNAMIVDSTALPEQAVRDILASAFQSAGQRCSALRCLYVQEDVADTFKDMLFGAMDEFQAGDPWELSTDTGPVIDKSAQDSIAAYVGAAREDGRVLKELSTPKDGTFVAPVVISVDGIADLEREVFGPVLHLATFRAEDFEKVLSDINATGYGLTFGIHSRIDDRVERAASFLKVGNIYVNRNQIGAVVGSQPFGGEGLSGTGPKAGGPSYLARFTRQGRQRHSFTDGDAMLPEISAVQKRIDNLPERPAYPLASETLPGPTGESNRLSQFPSGVVLCLGPNAASAREQMRLAALNGCPAIGIAPGLSRHDGISGRLSPEMLTSLNGFHAVAMWADDQVLRPYRRALADRDGAIIPLLSETDISERTRLERHICVDTTASGGNASLLAGDG